MFVFFTNYHVSVNDGMVDDLIRSGQTVVMPDSSFDQTHLKFFAPNDEHFTKAGVMPVTYEQFLAMPPMAIILNCQQLFDDTMALYEARGKKDVLVFLSSQLGLGEWLPIDVDYVISHSLDWHRACKAKYKTLYFSKPKVLLPTKTDEEIAESFANKQIRLYINHFENNLEYLSFSSFDNELKDATYFRKLWLDKHNWRIPFYGYQNADGYLTMEETQNQIKQSMFTLVFKGHETWGQMVNESMLLGTPCIFMDQYTVDMFRQYLINPDTAIVGNKVMDLIKKIDTLSLSDYENLVHEARSQSEMYTNENIRTEKLAWLFSKIASDKKMV